MMTTSLNLIAVKPATHLSHHDIRIRSVCSKIFVIRLFVDIRYKQLDKVEANRLSMVKVVVCVLP